MPFKFRIKRTRRYDVSSKHLYVLCVQLLDQTLIECTLSTDSTGRECIENIAQRIELKETQYFGLRYFNKVLQLHWLDLDRPVKKQVDKNDYCPHLYMGVYLYVSDVNRINDDMARYQYYLQLKHDILEGQLPCTPKQAVVLASYALQADFGDHDYSRHTPDDFKEYSLLPKSMTNNDLVYGTLMQQVITEHQRRVGLSASTAELQYIMAAMQLDGYGVECYPAKKTSGADLILGVSLAGLVLKLRSEQQTSHHFRWDDIQHLTHSKKIFSIQTTEKKTTDLHMDDFEVARYVWRMCVTQHTFYRAQKAFDRLVESKVYELPMRSYEKKSGILYWFFQPTKRCDVANRYNANGTYAVTQVAVRSEIIVHHVSKSSPNLHIQYSESSPVHKVGNRHNVNASVYSVHDAQVVLGSRERIIPPYRPSPDYDTVMQHRHFYQVRHYTDSLAHSQSIQQCNLDNLSQSGIYNKQEPLAYSQPDVHYSCVQNNRGYIAYSHPVSLSTRPVERVSSLIIQPTYSTPDLTNTHHQGGHHGYGYGYGPAYVTDAVYDYSASETMINVNAGMASGYAYRHPPAYYRTSSSTPDLARAPDTAMISGRNVDLSSFITRADTSLENVDERRSSSSSSDRTFHAKDDDDDLVDEDGANVFEPDPDYSDESLDTLDNSNASRTERKKKLNRSHERLDADDQTVEELEDGVERMLKYQQDVHLVDYVVAESQRVEAQERLQSQGSQEEKVEQVKLRKKKAKREEREDSFNYSGMSKKMPSASPVHDPFIRSSIHRKASIRSRKQKAKQESEIESEKSELRHNGRDKEDQDSVKHAETGKNGIAKDVPVDDEDTKVVLRKDVRGKKLDKVHETVVGEVVAGGESPEKRTKTRPNSVVFTDRMTKILYNGGLVDSPLRPQSYVQIGEAVSQTSPNSELRRAAENGLSISRAQLMFNANDESRAPKDERRKLLEAKLEDGTVESEFERIPRKVTTADCSIALMTENLPRNRYKDIQPYDNSRVRLKPKPDNPMGYINASHVRVRVKNQELWYLASQGPLDNTVEDFWSMVWEQDVQVVAMLTEVREYGSSKCAQYWPKATGSKHRMTHGDFVITLQFRNDSGCFVTSGLNVRNKAEGRERTVWHLQFTDWPDHGCPEDVHGFLAFLEEMESVQRHIMMESQDTKVFPILVHCTAGVGRTGVAILVEVMKACLEYNQNVDVPTVLATLRGQRMHMVQMQIQYAFVYKTLIQYLKNTRLI